MLGQIKRRAVPLVATALVMLLSAPLASANSILVSFIDVSGPAPLGEVRWNYEGDLGGTLGAGSTTLKAGDYFTLYDVVVDTAATTVANAGLSPTWTVTYTPTTATYIGSQPDDLVKMNVNFTYNDGNLLNDQVPLLMFSIISPIPLIGGNQVIYAGNDHKTSNNSLQTNSGQVLGPSAVPLPPAVWAGLSLMGLMGVQGVRRQRLKKAE